MITQETAIELLKALEDLADTVESCQGCSDFGSYNAEEDFEISKAHKAIAKAKKESLTSPKKSEIVLKL